MQYGIGLPTFETLGYSQQSLRDSGNPYLPGAKNLPDGYYFVLHPGLFLCQALRKTSNRQPAEIVSAGLSFVRVDHVEPYRFSPPPKII